MSRQPSLLEPVPDRVEMAHKRQRQTARNVYALGREMFEGRRGQILRILAAHWNAKQTSPTALELLEWALAQGESLFDVNSIRPRLTELERSGVIAAGTPRKCAVSGKVVHTWHVREAGD